MRDVLKRLKQLYDFVLFPWIVAIVGILFTGLIAWKSHEWILKTERERFNTAANQTTFLIQKKIESNVQLLLSTAALMDASETITSKEWKIFADRHKSFNRFPGLQAIGYVPRTADGFKIAFLEPLNARSQKAIGFNMSTSPVRKKAIEKAIENATVSFSSKIELAEEKALSERAGFVIYAPIYEKGASIATAEDRVKASKGVVYAAMKVKKLFGNLLGAQYIFIDFEIFDGAIPIEANKLYDTNLKLVLPRLERYSTIEFYGKKWTLYFKANEALDLDYNRYVPFVQLFFGVLFSIIVGLWMHALQRTRKEAYTIAEEKTKKLLETEVQTRTLFKVMQEGIIVYDATGRVIECNLAVEKFLGQSIDSIIGKTSEDLRWQMIHEDGTLFSLEERPCAKVLRTKVAQKEIIMGVHHEDGSFVWLLANAQPIFSQDSGEIVSVVVTMSDLTAFKASKYQLEKYVEIIDANVIISSTDCEGIITEVSEAFCKISGYSKEELIGQNHRIVRHPDVPDSFYKQMWEEIIKGHSWRGEMKNRCKDGSSYWVDAIVSPRYNEQNKVIGYTAIRHDITDKKRIEELSITDALTGLYNRFKLDELFLLHVSLAKRHGTPFSVIMLDIDNFKLVNDTYGHPVGDVFLKELSSLLKKNIRFEDTLGRWGGEEFLILLPSTPLSDALILSELLRERTQTFNFSVVGNRTISLGVASFHQGDDEKSIIIRADKALYQAKDKGRNRVETELYM